MNGNRLEATMGDRVPPSLQQTYSETVATLVKKARRAQSLARNGSQAYSLIDVLKAMPTAIDRYSTGIPPLDACLRGGIPPGRLYTFVGPPTRGKTALVVQLMLRLAHFHHLPARGLFPDEGNWQAALMALEGLGFDRQTLEDKRELILPDITAKTTDLDLALFDPDITLEAATDSIAHLDKLVL